VAATLGVNHTRVMVIRPGTKLGRNSSGEAKQWR